MDFIEDNFCANVKKYSYRIRCAKEQFCIRSQDHPLTFNRSLSYCDSFRLSSWCK